MIERSPSRRIQAPGGELAGAPASEAIYGLLDLVAERLAPRIAAELQTAAPEGGKEDEPWRLLDVVDAAARLGRSTRWVRERAKRGDLPFVKLDGGALAFELQDVQAFARARRISADKPAPLAVRLQRASRTSPRAAFAHPERATDPEVDR